MNRYLIKEVKSGKVRIPKSFIANNEIIFGTFINNYMRFPKNNIIYQFDKLDIKYQNDSKYRKLKRFLLSNTSSYKVENNSIALSKNFNGYVIYYKDKFDIVLEQELDNYINNVLNKKIR